MAAATEYSPTPVSAFPRVFLPLRQYVIVLLIAAALPALAQKRPDATGDQNTLALQMANVLQDEQRALAELHRRLGESNDPRAITQLELEADRVRLGAEVELLRLHAQRARRAGNQRLALRIEAAIEALTAAARERS
jgi:hypothetical protein